MNKYFHIINYTKVPVKSYGIAVKENRMIDSVPYDKPELSWMKKYTIDALIKFFEDKNVIITEVIASQTNNDETIGAGNGVA